MLATALAAQFGPVSIEFDLRFRDRRLVSGSRLCDRKSLLSSMGRWSQTSSSPAKKQKYLANDDSDGLNRLKANETPQPSGID